MSTSPDLLAWCEDALAGARDAAAAAYDRAEALATLRSLALERAAVLGVTTLTLEQFRAGLKDEESRAPRTTRLLLHPGVPASWVAFSARPYADGAGISQPG